jgi:hypothetical protein
LSRLREVLRKADAPGWEEASPKRMGPWRVAGKAPEGAPGLAPQDAIAEVTATEESSVATKEPGADTKLSPPPFGAAAFDGLTAQHMDEGLPHHNGAGHTLSRFSRFTRKVRRWFGMPVGRTPARCSGNTRNGMPCRAPAMDNGFCRMHGGVRQRSIVEMMR